MISGSCSEDSSDCAELSPRGTSTCVATILRRVAYHYPDNDSTVWKVSFYIVTRSLDMCTFHVRVESEEISTSYNLNTSHTVSRKYSLEENDFGRRKYRTFPNAILNFDILVEDTESYSSVRCFTSAKYNCVQQGDIVRYVFYLQDINVEVDFMLSDGVYEDSVVFLSSYIPSQNN